MSQSQGDSPSFLDPKMILVIVFCFSCLLLWQSYLANKYPDYYKRPVPAENPENNEKSSDQPQRANNRKSLDQGPQIDFEQETANREDDLSVRDEILLPFRGEKFSFNVSSFGLGLKDIQIHQYKDRDGEVVSFSSQEPFPLFATKIGGQKHPLFFNIESPATDDGVPVFVGHIDVDGVKIQKTLTVDQDNYSIFSDIKMLGEIAKIEGIESVFSEKVKIVTSSIPFLPSYDTNSYYVAYSTDSQRGYFSNENLQESLDNVGLLSIDTHYFARSFIDSSDIFPKIELVYSADQQVVSGRLFYDLSSSSDDALIIKQQIFIGPKQKDILVSADARLKDVLDYGFFAWIAYPIMDLIRFFFSLVGNWGVAIILMTCVIRLLLLPFNVMAYRSMKKVQDIQPQMQALKEKYKDDREALNKATVELMKNSGANPIGGCLPMLLQIPVFIALFKVLGNAIEFYQAPFFLWITDLTEPDPFFVLPVLMALSMILHQKLSPTTADPNVRRMMLVVTVIFSLFMVVYPSGLALYIFVGSLFSILQQGFLMREKSQNAT